VFMNRIDKDGLDRLIAAVFAVVFAPALRGAETDPIGGLVAGAGVWFLDKGFQQYGSVGIDAMPVREQKTNVMSKQVGGQVRHADEGQNEEPGVVDDLVQILLPDPGRPADVPVPAARPWENARYLRCSPTVWQ